MGRKAQAIIKVFNHAKNSCNCDVCEIFADFIKNALQIMYVEGFQHPRIFSLYYSLKRLKIQRKLTKRRKLIHIYIFSFFQAFKNKHIMNFQNIMSFNERVVPSTTTNKQARRI